MRITPMSPVIVISNMQQIFSESSALLFGKVRCGGEPVHQSRPWIGGLHPNPAVCVDVIGMTPLINILF